MYFLLDSVSVLYKEMMTVSSGEKMIAGCAPPLGRLADAPKLQKKRGGSFNMFQYSNLISSGFPNISMHNT